MKYSIEKIATLIGARRIGTTDSQIGWLLTDSRSLCFPEETLFFALKTQRNDGHRYIEDLYRRGVRNFVVSKSPKGYEDANFLVVPSPLAALQRLAERHRDEFNCPVVGITGSNGKTMVKEWLYQVLSPSFHVVRSPKSYNSQIGVPLSVWLMNEQTDVALIEAGISQPDEMSQLADIIQPTIGVLTSLGAAHQENFRSLEEKCMEKLQLFRDAKVLIFDADDETISHCVRRSGFRGEKIAWHLGGQQTTDNGLIVTLNTQLGPNTQYHLPFIDEASVECSLAVAATALYLGISPEELDKRMSQLEPVAMRLEVKEGQHGCTIINDTYNSDINSLDIALDFMQRRLVPPNLSERGGLPAESRLPSTLILSDIQQSGMSDELLYQEVNGLITKRGVDNSLALAPASAHREQSSL